MNRPCFHFFFLCAALLFGYSGTGQSKKQKKAIAAANQTTLQNLIRHIGVLAHDSLEGRRTGTAGEEKAVRYIENHYKSLGIAGAASQGGYRQNFQIDEGKFPDALSHCILNDDSLAWEKDYLLMPWSHAGTVKATGSVSLLESGEPWWYDLADLLEENKNNPHFLADQALREKVKGFAEKGATAVLVYNNSQLDDGLKYNPKDRMETVGIPVFYITRSAVQRLKISENADYRLHASIRFENKYRNGINVAALYHSGAPYTLVLGAHLDHLGYGEDGNSRAAGEKSIHNGADDNASGTAAVLELARIIRQRNDNRFNYLFLHFSGEELGLYGSKYFVENPTDNLSQVSYMINLDMVGRLNDSSRALTIGGVGTSPVWPALLAGSGHHSFSLKIDSSGTGPSDHTSFYRKDIPVLFFFTGLHTDYHKPGDDANKINYTGELAIIQFIDDLIKRSDNRQKLAFTKTREQNMGTGRFKVSIGIMPDYTFSGQGVRADGLVDGRPAQKAGLQAGDVIIQLGDYLITGVDTYMQALNRFEKGQSTTVVVKRGNEILNYPLTF
jgi:hypothetical protein